MKRIIIPALVAAVAIGGLWLAGSAGASTAPHAASGSVSVSALLHRLDDSGEVDAPAADGLPRTCTGGRFGYSNHTSDAPNWSEGDWETTPSCETQARVEADTAFHKYYSGWVDGETLELTYRATATDNANLTTSYWMERAPGSTTCTEIRIYPSLGSFFIHSC